MAGWIDKPLGEILPALRSGKLTPVALYEEASARHEALGQTLCAYRVWDSDTARAQAREAEAAFRDGRDCGPLQGIPVSVKDLFGVDYLDTTAGTPRALPEKWNEEGPVIKAVREQKAVITGKTHTVEFAFGGLGANPHWPVPRNPWDADEHRVPGGSSSGAGVSLIEGSALVALGSDTAGSVRVPASFTGTVGLKTTAGRWPLAGIFPLSPTFDTAGVLTRTVADAALAFAAIDGHCSSTENPAPIRGAELSRIRIGVPEKHFQEGGEPSILRCFQDALIELERGGATLVSLELPQADEAFSLFRRGSVVSSELRAFLETEMPDRIQTMDPNVSHRMAGALALSDPEITRRRERIEALAHEAELVFSDVDFLASPTVPISPPRLAEIRERDAYAAANLPALSNTCIANILGFCAITIPVALDAAGMPTGLQLMAAADADARLLAGALAAERRLGPGPERLGPPPVISNVVV